MKCPSYDGTAMTWTAWYIAFTAWVAWKEPRLVDLLRQGAASCPTPSNWMSPTPTEIEEVEKWNMLNIRLYGSILMHMSEPLRVSLHTAANTDGCGAIEYLKKRYGAHSSGDRTEAAARMQRSFIDPRAPMSTDDLALQYNEMSQAVADLVTSGGSQPDGQYLISLLENALPASYAQVRQMVRYRRHTDFEDYYQDVLEQVKAEVRSTTQPAVGAFSFQRSEQPGTSRTERPGAPRGLGANPCFNCGSTQCTRVTSARTRESSAHTAVALISPPSVRKDQVAHSATHSVLSPSAPSAVLFGSRSRPALRTPLMLALLLLLPRLLLPLLFRCPMKHSSQHSSGRTALGRLLRQLPHSPPRPPPLRRQLCTLSRRRPSLNLMRWKNSCLLLIKP